MERMTLSPDLRRNTAHVVPDGGDVEHDRAGGWCPCRPIVLEVLDAPGGTLIGFIVAHRADGQLADADGARRDLIAGLPDRLRARVA